MFLLDNGFITIRDANGNKVTFDSVEDFESAHASALVFTDKEYICYEPDREIHVDLEFDPPHIWDGPNKDLEDVIKAYSSLKTKRNDPFRGKDYVAIKAVLWDMIRAKASAYIYSKWPMYEQVNGALGLMNTAELNQMKAHISEVKDAVLRIKNDIQLATTKAALKAIDLPKPSFAPEELPLRLFATK
jgi:uncharacterized protein YrzB (UPF0473 family)